MRSTKVASAVSDSAMTILAICLVLALSGCSYSFTGKSLNVGVVSAGVADLVTTHQAIQQGRGREGNPLLGDHALQQVLVKSGLIGAVIGLAHLGDSRGIWGHVIRSAAIGIQGYAAIHNGRIGR